MVDKNIEKYVKSIDKNEFKSYTDNDTTTKYVERRKLINTIVDDFEKKIVIYLIHKVVILVKLLIQK